MVFLVAFILLLAIGAGAGVTLAKTGLVNVPILSSTFQSSALPTRFVEPAAVLPGNLAETLSSKLESEMLRSGMAPDSVVITESEATALVRSYMRARQSAALIDPQVVFLNGAIEFFGTLEVKEKKTTLRILAAAGFEGGAIQLRIREIEVGAVTLPSYVPGLIAAAMLKNQIQNLEEQFLQSPIESITLHDGFLEIRINPERAASFGR